MPIGEFDGAATLPGDDGFLATNPLYWLYEMGQTALNPARALADSTRLFFRNPINPWSHTTYGKSIAAAAEVFERTTRRYARPEWNIDSTTVGGERVAVKIETVWERPFCKLIHFERALTRTPRRPQPKLLVMQGTFDGHKVRARLRQGEIPEFLLTTRGFHWINERPFNR